MRPAFIPAALALAAFGGLSHSVHAEALPRGATAPGGIMIAMPRPAAGLPLGMPAINATVPAPAPRPAAPQVASAAPPPMPRVMVPAQPAASPAAQCRQAIRAIEKEAGVPEHLMAAIARVESGRADEKGVVHPWPWTINAEGKGSYYETKAEAIAAVRALQARGVKSIDVGCMQVNLMFHAEAFPNLDIAFDPMANARYAAKFLQRLREQAGDWTKATANYHSATPELGNAYERRVAAALPGEQQRQASIAPATAMNMWSQNAWSQNAWNTGGGGQMLNNKADTARILPMSAGGTARGLDAYRAAPVAAIIPAARMAQPGAIAPPVPLANAAAKPAVSPRTPPG